jgi:flagellar assembly factor FliW
VATKEQIVKLLTTRFGTVEVPDKDVLFFSSGVLGFPEIRRYVMLDHGRNTPLKWLQAVDKPELAFPMVPATDLMEDYHITVAPEDLAALGKDSTAELQAFVILTIPNGAPERTTANLKAPIVMNPTTHLARQVLVEQDYPIRYPLSVTQPATAECAG